MEINKVTTATTTTTTTIQRRNHDENVKKKTVRALHFIHLFAVFARLRRENA